MSQWFSKLIKIVILAVILIISGVIASLSTVTSSVLFLCIAFLVIMLNGLLFVTPLPFPWNRRNGWIYFFGLLLLVVILVIMAMTKERI